MVRRCRHPLFKGRHFDQEIIILCVRWYVDLQLSYRDLAGGDVPCLGEGISAFGGSCCVHAAIANIKPMAWTLRGRTLLQLNRALPRLISPMKRVPLRYTG